MGDKFHKTPQQRDPTGSKRLAGHGSYRSPMNLELRGEDEGRTESVDAGGISSRTKQGTIGKPLAQSSGKGSGEYGQRGPGEGPGNFKGKNQGWPFTLPKGRDNSTGFNEPE